MMSSKDAPSPEIMNVREIIECAFGNLDGNAVNFKLIQTVLFLIARQMKILERRVEVELGPLSFLPSASTFSVTEVKLHAVQEKKKVAKGKPGAKGKPKAKTGGAKPGGAPKPETDSDILNDLEALKEKELRVIHQRIDSFEEPKKSPTPMASLSSMEEQYEKLLVVKQVPSSVARQEAARTPQISVVTQEQFQQVANAVRELEKKFLPPGTPGFPQNAELMEQLRKGASLTDAMAALQLSARLEATEAALTQMTLLVTELVKSTPGVRLDSQTQTLVITEQKSRPVSRDGKDTSGVDISTSTTVPPSDAGETAPEEGEAEPEDRAEAAIARGYITFADLYEATTQMKAELLKTIQDKTKSTINNAENAFKLSTMLDSKIDTSPAINARMAAVESAVKLYADRINALDTELSSQMTMYQEQLTQMQHDLEVGLDTLNEVLGNAGSDTEAMAELHGRFNGLQVDFELLATEQKNLKDMHKFTTWDLASLWKQVEALREIKSDREEVADALRDKAGIGELNGLVSIDQFEAVRSDFGKRIHAAFDKFNTQEISWQKSIEAVIRVFNEKADLVQVENLRNDINKHLNNFKARMKVIADIVGEPKSAMISKKLFRDAACLSCGSPAHMDMEEPFNIPAFPKFRRPAEGAEEETQIKGAGDYGICYPDLPIPHPRDPRSHTCKRYCGGSHTMLSDPIHRPPHAMILKPLGPLKTAPGTDGKSYLVDEEPKMIPCLACNKPIPVPQNQGDQDDISDDCACGREGGANL